MPARLFLLTAAAVALRAQAEVDPLLEAGRSQFAARDYSAAAHTLEQAWKQAEQTPSGDQRRYEVARLMSAALTELGKYGDADDYLQIAINWRENQLGFHHPEVADDLVTLAQLSRRSKNFAKALAVMDRVREIHIKAGGRENPLLADDFSLTARLYVELEDFERGAAVYRVALEAREKFAGREHPALLPDLDRLAIALITLRQYDKAEEIYRRALTIRERTLGPTDSDLLQSLDGLAYSLFGQRKYADAEPVYQRLLALWEASAGPEHPMIPLTLDKLVVFYREQERLDEAGAAALRANSLRALFYARGFAREGDFARTRGGRTEAAQFYRQALAALDASDKGHQKLRAQLETSLNELEPTPPPRRKSPGSPATGKASSSGRK